MKESHPLPNVAGGEYGPVNLQVSDAERQAFLKIGRRFMPVLIISYVLNYLDRTNISFAALTMQDAIGLTGTQLGIGAGIFFAATRCSRYRATSRSTKSGRGAGSAGS